MFVLKIVKGREFAGTAAELRLPPPPAKVAIGRDPKSTWPLPDPTLALSARHCEIVVGSADAVLRDLSTNGTYVNGAAGRMTQDHVLAAGDALDLGPYRIVVEPLVAAARHEPADDSVTRIRPPARPQPLPDLPLPDLPPPTDTPATADPLLAALADGLGVDAQALAGRDALETARRTGLIARAAVTGLRRLLEQEARARRRLGSRQTMAQPLRAASPLRMARTPDDAVLRLLVSDAEALDTMRDACAELLGHHERLQVAFAGAARRLGQDLEPASLDGALGPAGGAPGTKERKAALWDLYVHLWQALGMASDDLWSRGFIDAAMVHLTSAYDEGAQDQEAAVARGDTR